MKVTVTIVGNDGTEIQKNSGNVVIDGDVSRMVQKLIDEFRRNYPNESLFNSWRIVMDSAEDSTI